MVANILPTDTPDPWDGVNRSKFNFLEYGHVAYQIKENPKCSNIIANFLPTDNPTLGSVGQNSFFFNMVLLHIKLRRVTNTATS